MRDPFPLFWSPIRTSHYTYSSHYDGFSACQLTASASSFSKTHGQPPNSPQSTIYSAKLHPAEGQVARLVSGLAITPVSG